MVTKAEIQSIDFNSNICQVRIPIFEDRTGNKVVCKATFAIPPGVYNGFQVGDVVYVAFEDGHISTPVVIGKLFLGTAAEASNLGGAINCSSFTLTKESQSTYIELQQLVATQTKQIQQLENKMNDLMKTINTINAK